MKRKVNHALSNNEPLLCIGFQLPEFSLSNLSNSKEFTKPVYFSYSNFSGVAVLSKTKFEGKADFFYASFQGEALFDHSEFYRKTYFSGHFKAKTNFSYVLFEGKEKVIFDVENLSNVSFMNTDLTGVRFSDNSRRRGGGINVDNIIRKLE